VVASPEIDLSKLTLIPEEFGNLHLEMKYKRRMLAFLQDLNVDVVLIEDGLERTVDVLSNGYDWEWQTLVAESLAENTVQLVLVNHISGWGRNLLIDEVNLVITPSEE
jgi:hypothetical protein